MRVFARVRPFLPSDGFDTSDLPEPSVCVRADGHSLRTIKHGDDGKEQSFSFDKVRRDALTSVNTNPESNPRPNPYSGLWSVLKPGDSLQ